MGWVRTTLFVEANYSVIQPSELFRVGQNCAGSWGDIGPLGVWTFVNRDEITQQQQAADAFDSEQRFRQRETLGRSGVKEAHRLLADRSIQHELERIGVRGRLD